MYKQATLSVLAAILLMFSSLPAQAQNGGTVPQWMTDYRGEQSQLARGILDGNLIETNFRNHGELSRYNDRPFGIWPRGTTNRHIDGIGFYVSGRVTGERLKWPQFFPEATADTILTPASHHFRPDAGGVKAPLGP
ncbi:MAG: hypothetical protein LAT52_08820, partial [Balneolales bacterium]|nr:hypothetical protein [Balneolales bacterium]